MSELKDTGYVCLSASNAFLEPKRSAVEHKKHFLSKQLKEHFFQEKIRSLTPNFCSKFYVSNNVHYLKSVQVNCHVATCNHGKHANC